MTARFARWARFRIRESNREIVVVNAHYSPVRLVHRLVSTGILRRYVPPIADRTPLIILGDLNAAVGMPSVTGLINGLSLYDAVGPTHGGSFTGWSGTSNRTRIDHVLVSEDFFVENAWIERYRPGGRVASDHDPVVAELRIE
jgi:endonuclease/exonuclease/phosphatase family metal-dependent hydrolase